MLCADFMAEALAIGMPPEELRASIDEAGLPTARTPPADDKLQLADNR